MDSALIITHTEKSLTFFTDMLREVRCDDICTVKNCGEARRKLNERDFDICIINAPLPDETGENLARYIAEKFSSQVLFIVKADVYDEISAAVEEAGVVTISKPINRGIFWSALKLAGAAHVRMRKMQAENKQLVQKIEDIKIIDRAKYLLISCLSMSEPDAHKYIERQAMDLRVTRRAVAEGIIKTYEF